MNTEDTHSGKLYYGWYITFALAITETISWGIVFYAFSVFITPMEAELGWSRSELTGGFSLSLLVAGAMAYPVGAWIDKHGARLLMTVGSILASLLIIAWSEVDNLTSFYLIWAGLGVCSAAILYEPAFAVIATWFIRRRSTALAVVTFAAGLASTIFVPLSDALLQASDWRRAVFTLGVFLAVTTIPLHALVLRRRPDDLGILADGDGRTQHGLHIHLPGSSLSEALHNRFFWVLTLSFSLSYLAGSAIRVHFIPFLIDSGIDASTAAFASGSIGFMQVVGRLIFAPLEPRLPGRIMVGGVFAVQTLAISVLLLGPTPLLVGIFILSFGPAFGAKTLARPAILAQMFGSRNYGRISSVMAIFLTLASTAAPVGAGLLYDRDQNYDTVIWLIVILSALATIVMFITRPDSDSEKPMQARNAKPASIEADRHEV